MSLLPGHSVTRVRLASRAPRDGGRPGRQCGDTAQRSATSLPPEKEIAVAALLLQTVEPYRDCRHVFVAKSPRDVYSNEPKKSMGCVESMLAAPDQPGRDESPSAFARPLGRADFGLRSKNKGHDITSKLVGDAVKERVKELKSSLAPPW